MNEAELEELDEQMPKTITEVHEKLLRIQKAVDQPSSEIFADLELENLASARSKKRAEVAESMRLTAKHIKEFDDIESNAPDAQKYSKEQLYISRASI